MGIVCDCRWMFGSMCGGCSQWALSVTGGGCLVPCVEGVHSGHCH